MANRRLPRGGDAVSSVPCRGRAAIHESAPSSQQGGQQGDLVALMHCFAGALRFQFRLECFGL
jgi:hypothetical protein